MRLSTRSLAAASARHPRRTIGAWIVVAALAIAAIVALLGGSLTTEGAPDEQPGVGARRRCAAGRLPAGSHDASATSS